MLKIPKYIDLHTHTVASDGFLKPSELVRLAAEKGISALSITDHDTLDGVRHAVSVAEEYGIELVPGIELSAEFDAEMHILGYFIDIESIRLNKALSSMKAKLVKEFVKAFSKLNEIGIEISPIEVREKSGTVNINSMIKLIVEKGYSNNRYEAYERYFARGKPAYVKSSKLSPQECIELIKDAGGISVLAHPIRLNKSDEDFENILRNLKIYGLDGIECIHSAHTKVSQAKFSMFAEKYKLLMTGGSDFHGYDNLGDNLGEGFGRTKIPYELLQSIKSKYIACQHKCFNMEG